jgi:toxin ParE1/3/4
MPLDGFLIWRRRARRDIQSIGTYLEAQNPVAAKSQLEIVFLRSRDLEDHPQLGKPGRLAGTRELVVPRTPYILIYRITPKGIDILRVLHTKRDWPPRRRASSSSESG